VGDSRAPSRTETLAIRSVLSLVATTIGLSPSQTLSTTVSSTRRTSFSMYGSAIFTTGSPARAAAARVNICGPSE
jgi:hypothetical protein